MVAFQMEALQRQHNSGYQFALELTKEEGSCLRALLMGFLETSGGPQLEAACWTRWTLGMSHQGCAHFLHFFSPSAKLL